MTGVNCERGSWTFSHLQLGWYHGNSNSRPLYESYKGREFFCFLVKSDIYLVNVEKKKVFTEIKVIYLREGRKKESVHRDKVIYLREGRKKESVHRDKSHLST